MRVVELLRENSLLIHPALRATCADDVIRELAAFLAEHNPEVTTGEVADALAARERLGSTAIGNGLAIPHSKLASSRRLLACFGRSVAGIEFAAPDGEPIRFFFVLIAPESAPGLHLTALARNALRYSGSGEMRQLAGGRLLLVGMDLNADSPLVHSPLSVTRRGVELDFLVLAVQGAHGLRIPTGADPLQPGERAFVLTTPENVTELAILSGYPWHHVRRVLIIGCGDTGVAVASRLRGHGMATTIVERDAERASFVAGLLPHALVIHGDASDPDLLRDRIEEDRIDGVVVLLPEAEKSLLIGIFASSLGTGKVVVRCDQAGYLQLASATGIDAMLSPKRAMADAILRYMRAEAVESSLLLGDHEAELLHLRIPQTPSRPDLVTRRLGELPFPEGTLVGAVIRNGTAEIAHGGTILRPHDELLVVSRPAALEKLEKLLS